MTKSQKIILAALTGNFVLAAFLQVITGSADVWWIFISLVAVFVPIMIGDAIREKKNRS